MSEETPVAPATRADRLSILLKRILPKQAKRIDSGEWGKQGAPYAFHTRPDGQRLTVKDEDTEEVIAVVGANRDELLDKLEQRFPG